MPKEEHKNNKYDLEKRLIDFAVRIINVVEALPNTRAANHIGGQLLRCGTAPASNYGEAQSAESRNDFIHKIKIVLKELRETRVWLKIIVRVSLAKSTKEIEALITECDELILIFVTSVKTAEKNKYKKKG
ncbi:MAG: four helix bundle protein [Planctomycetes bacterium]|nr:four helix bundle protein [Planctomycetota bacterium]